MIIGDIKDCGRFEKLNPYFKKVFAYLKSHDFSVTEPGRIEIDGDNVWISVAEPECRSMEEADIEVHKVYVDIQMVIEGEEIFGWRAERNLRKERIAYDPDKDIAFYADEAEIFFTLSAGKFVIFFPEDGHAPCIGKGKVKKLVAKIKAS